MLVLWAVSKIQIPAQLLQELCNGIPRQGPAVRVPQLDGRDGVKNGDDLLVKKKWVSKPGTGTLMFVVTWA